MDKSNLKNNMIKWAIGGVTLVLFFIVFFKLWEFDITKPYVYRGKDDFVFNVIAKNAMNGNSYFLNPNLGAPYGMELYYFPFLMQTYILWCKIVGLFTNNWVVAVNLYLFLTYILSVAAFMYMCVRIGVKNKTLSYLCALVFAFSHYHLECALGHFTAASYFVIPLFIVLFYNMAVGKYEGKNGLKNMLEIIVICVVIGCTDIYYAFFGCFLLCIMLVDSVIKKRWKTVVVGIGIIIGIVLVILICLSPAIMYSLKNGENVYAAARTPYDAYWVGFLPISLFLPMGGSCGILSQFTKMYKGVSGLPRGEVLRNYVGLIGLVGLGYTIYYILFKKDKDEKQDLYIRLNIATIFLGTVGGIGLIVSFFITDKIRTYTRVFPYIFAFLIIAVCFLFERLCEKSKKWFYILLLLVIIHFIDLSSWSILSEYEISAQKYDADKKFISNIEQFTNDGDYILQLPYVTGLENYIAGIGNCNYHSKGFLLQTKNLGWSYGTLVGTNADTAYKEKFDTNSVEQILFFAKQLGYSGIYVDISMLEKADWHIVQDLKEELGYVSLISENRKIFYFDIKDYQMENEFKAPMIVYNDGFYKEERYENITWRWSKSESAIEIYSFNGAASAKVKIELHSFEEKMRLAVWSGNNISLFDITNDAQTITIPVKFIDGVAELNFLGDSFEYENGTSGRELSFRINNVIVE